MDIEIGKKSKINIHWKVNPYDYSKEKINSLIAKFSKKYSISKERIKVVPEFIMLNDNGEKISIATDVIANIQNPEFQLKLFKEYLSVNNIENYDFNLLQKIDAEINAKIDYTVYDKFKRYSINWVKWDNFLSYGEDNYFDFRTLKGLVLLNGEPANQSGKTTFAIDLIHFLLFGKTEKSSVQEKIFNKHLKEATKVVVEGCLTIEGQDYLIKRELSRPSLDKRTSKSKTTQKVFYYKVINGSLEELEDYVENQQEENSVKTNKVIKESIGNESDFDMIICATSSNLDDLIEKKDTERGKLLSRWIGLLPIEEKDKLAREKFNSEVKPTLLSNHYNSESLKQEIEAYKINISTLKEENIRFVNENKILDEDISTLESNSKALSESKSLIDNSLMRLDINTLNKTLEKVMNDGKNKKIELDNIINELEKLKDVNFSITEYNEVNEKFNKLNLELNLDKQKYTMSKKTLNDIKKSEFCPVCGRRYDNIDNSAKIAEIEKELEVITEDGKVKSKELKVYQDKLHRLIENQGEYERKNKLSVLKSTCELKIEQLRNEYKDNNSLLKEYNKNTEAIDKNNQLDIQIRNIEVKIKGKRNNRETNIRYIEKNESEIKNYTKCIDDRVEIINLIKEEVKLIRHWRIYLDMVGKNGISKMVLRKTLPIINAQITHLLSDVCDFTVDISINEKNDVMFYLVKDDVKSDLTSGSGFEKTAAALALRTVLGNISTLPRMNFLICDELLGRVASENYDNMRTLYEKMLTNYDFIIQISHLNEIKDWHDKIITVKKENNISKLNITK